MSIRTAIQFTAIIYVPSGSATEVDIDLKTNAVSFTPPGAAGNTLSTLFDITKTLPAGIKNVSCPGFTVTDAELETLLGIPTGKLTITLSAAPAVDSYHTITGFLYF